jgi:hypothetical protein
MKLKQIIARNSNCLVGFTAAVDIKSLPAGIYFYQVNTLSNQMLNGKFIKK